MSIQRWSSALFGGALIMATATPGALAQRKDKSQSAATKFQLGTPVIAGSQPSTGPNDTRIRIASHRLTGFEQESEEVDGNAVVWDVDEFFNVRQANSDVEEGEWELELGTRWFTGGGEGDDDFFIAGELAYGLTDDAFIELKVLPVNIGDGGDQGNGDIGVDLFNRFVKETDSIPSIAFSLEGRFPTGEGSSGVDGELGLHLTKTIAPRTRMHLEGFVETANGGRTEEEEEEGRHFQWGAGVGFDHEFSEQLLGIVNYVNRASEEFGERNEQLLELGVNYKIAPTQGLKVAADIGLTGVGDEPNFGVKIQYEIEID